MNHTFFSRGYNQVLGTIALIALVVSLSAYAYLTWQQSEYMYSGPTTISVSGEGEVVAIPDIGKFSFTVTESGVDAATALEASGSKINKAIADLKAAGVEEKDIKTENYNLYPKFKYENRPCIAGSFCGGEQIPDGFEVSQSIAVKVRDLDKAGELLSMVGGQVTNVSGLEFTIDDDSALQNEARSLAIADAKAKAKILAKDLGVTLDKMVGYNEGDYSAPAPYNRSSDDMMAFSEAKFEGPELPLGENKTTSVVTLTYQIK